METTQALGAISDKLPLTHCFYPLLETFTFKNLFNSHKPPNGGDTLLLPCCKETESQGNRLPTVI